MHRREIMSWAGIAAAGAFLAPASTLAASPAARRPAESFVPAKDGTSLFVRDWGAGRPVLFLAGWALPSDFWGYQMLALARQGYRAIAYDRRSEEHTSELQSLMRISYAVFCLKKKKTHIQLRY